MLRVKEEEEKQGDGGEDSHGEEIAVRNAEDVAKEIGGEVGHKTGGKIGKENADAHAECPIMAMALSPRTSRLRLNQSMPRPLARAKQAAPKMGENPQNAPIPTPPSEACAMPPPAMTKRRVTT